MRNRSRCDSHRPRGIGATAGARRGALGPPRNTGRLKYRPAADSDMLAIHPREGIDMSNHFTGLSLGPPLGDQRDVIDYRLAFLTKGECPHPAN